MKVLIACEFSCQVRNAFLARGHDAYSCDLLECWGRPFERHYRQDVRPLLKRKWDLVIAHPPCTYLSNAGICFLRTEPGRFDKMVEACAFFLHCLESNAKGVCVENPIQHAEARKRIPKYSQIIHPWQYGHTEHKPTCLWLKGLPELQPTEVVEPKPKFNLDGSRNMSGHHNAIRRLAPRRFTPQLRSITFSGIAQAMAQQWG